MALDFFTQQIRDDEGRPGLSSPGDTTDFVLGDARCGQRDVDHRKADVRDAVIDVAAGADDAA